MDENAEVHKRREHERHSVSFETTLIVKDQRVHCDICDISAGGARIRAAVRLGGRTPVVLDVDPLGSLPGHVVWSGDEFLAIKFSEGPEKVAGILMAMIIYA